MSLRPTPHTTCPSHHYCALRTHFRLNPLPIVLFSSAFSPHELEDFFHATEVLTSNHRQYSIDALNATQLNREADRERERERERDRDAEVGGDRERCDSDSILSPNTGDISNKKYKSSSSSSSSSSHPQSGCSSSYSGNTAYSHLNTQHNNPSSKGKATHTAQHTHTHPHTEPSSGKSNNNHLNPFYEIGRMTADDLRNHRYNSGLEEPEEGSWYVTSRHDTTTLGT
jgi:hypothetical protein